jgi:alkaline phosphatase
MKRIILAFVALGGCLLLNAQETKLAQFGLITDTHVCDKADQSPVISLNATPRYFTGGLAKIEAFAKAMNVRGAAFVAELGDWTDDPADPSLSVDQRLASAKGFAGSAEAKLALFKGPRYHVFGNHDTDLMSKDDYLTQISNNGIAGQASYYSWKAGGVHFIVLDADFKTDGSSYSGRAGDPGAGYAWDDANLSPAEVAWLKADLSSNKLPTIVFVHQPLNPQELIDPAFDPHYAARNAADVRSLLEKSGTVIAVFSGHYHDGGYQLVNGIPYVVLQASCAYGNDVAYHNQYAFVEVYQDGKNCKVVVDGNGLQRSYVLRASLK